MDTSSPPLSPEEAPGMTVAMWPKDDGFEPLLQRLNQMAVRATTARAESAQRNRMAVSATRDFSSYMEPTNFLTFSKVDRGLGLNIKPRIDTETMRRVLDNVHDLSGDTIEMRMRHRKVPGVVRWKEQDLYGLDDSAGSQSSFIATTGTSHSVDLGPGCYRTETFYQGPHAGGISHGTLPFLEQDAVKQENQFKITMKERHSSLNRSAAFRSRGRPATGLDSERASSSSPARELPGGRFGVGGDRWRAPEYRAEGYLKTTGLTLSPDYDRAYTELTKVPITLTAKTPRFRPNEWPYDYSNDVEVIVDMPHTSVATSARLSPLKLSAAFRSKAPAGFTVQPPTSGWDIGPGSYKGSLEATEAIQIKGRGSGDLSIVFRSKSPRIAPVKAALNDLDMPLPSLLDPTKGSTFSQSGASGLKNNFLAEWTAKKISQIYPKFRGGMFVKKEQGKTATTPVKRRKHR
jgi:hypothetical protein